MPPRMSTAGGADAVRFGLVHVTLVITVAHCGHDSASASTSNSCSGVIARSTVLTKRNGAVSMKSSTDAFAWEHSRHAV